jgi:retron-type reverse transcriptase
MVRTGTINKLQDLRQKIYVAAKSNKQKRFWGMYCHVTKEETLYEAYRQVKRNNGAPGIDGITFKLIEETGLTKFITTIKEELTDGTYRPARTGRKKYQKPTER